jgi:hypothetical protein
MSVSEQQQDNAMSEKIAPVQGYAGGIPWSMHLRAYDAYCKKWGPQPAMIDLEGRNCRGGFAADELDEFIPGWREELSEIKRLRTILGEARAAIASLDPMALGGQHANHPEEQEWYFRDELLSRIDEALSS